MNMKEFKDNVLPLFLENDDMLIDVRERVFDEDGEWEDHNYLGSDGLEEDYNDYEVYETRVYKYDDGLCLEITIDAPTSLYTVEVGVRFGDNIMVHAHSEAEARIKAKEAFLIGHNLPYILGLFEWGADIESHVLEVK